MAEVVWTLDKQRRVELKSMAVVFSSPEYGPLGRMWERFLPKRFVSSTEFAKLITSFYKALGTRYRDTARGQQHSLIPLPLFALDIETHSDKDLQNALERLGAWMKTLREFFERNVQTKIDDCHKMWESAVESLMLDLRTEYSPSSQCSASEKVRSILLHLLWTCCVKSESTASELGRGMGGDVKTPGQKFEDLSKIFVEAMVDAKALCPVLKRYKYVQFVDVNWVQGCEFDVVVTYAKARLSRYETIVFGSLSRAKLLSILIIPAKTEKEAKARWVTPWRDWSELAQISA
jgi:hypothetical protein